MNYLIRNIKNVLIRNYCSFCKLDRFCLGTEIRIQNDEIKIKKKNPCNTCKNFMFKKDDNIGYCSLYFMKEEKHFFVLNVLDARKYSEFCGPCGKNYIKK